MPAGVDALAAMVMTEVPLPGATMGLTLKLTVGGFTTLGEMETEENVTAESNPVAMVLVIVEGTLEPCATETEAGEADRVNPGGGVTTRLKVAVCVMPAPDAVTVIV